MEIRLERKSPRSAVRSRSYRVRIERDLFGAWVLVVASGAAGGAGRLRVLRSGELRPLIDAAQRLLRGRARRGYVVVAVGRG